MATRTKGKDMMEQRTCTICGKTYQPIRGNQKTCLADECQHELHRRYVREHNKFIKSCKGKTIKEYKRDMMRKYREESKRAKEKKASGSKLKRWCKNCEWREFDKVDGVCACVNPDSPKCAEIVNDHDGCEVWE